VNFTQAFRFLKSINFKLIFQTAGKRDTEQEAEAQHWIETITGERFPPGLKFEEVLRDGIFLCKLMNRLQPGLIQRINTSGGDYKMMDNLSQ
jgi:transgelin